VKLDTPETLLKPTSKNLPRDVTLMAELMGGSALTISPQQTREMPLTTRRDQLTSVAARPA
jgi:hypothetical protein